MRYAISSLVLTAALLHGGCTPDRPLAPDTEVDPPDLGVLATRLPVTGYAQVSANLGYGCALRTEGVVVCWPGSYEGTLHVPLITDGIQITTGFAHVCALRAGGTVVCWGESAPALAVPEGLSGVSQVSTHSSQNCALIESDGSVVCWGGDISGSTRPPDGLVGVSQVSAGWGHMCALKSDRTVVCWGFDGNGEATPPAGLNDVEAIDAGDGHSCALRATGTVICWGWAEGGRTEPPADLTDVVQISAGYDHTCALTSDADVVCWGNLYHLPGDIEGDIVEIHAGYFQTCVLLRDSSVDCHGVSDPPERILPEATFEVSDSSVDAGASFTLALRDAWVPGYSGPVSFTYAFDCGAGYGGFTSADTATCEISTGGEHEVRGKVMDQDDDVTEYTGFVDVAADETPPTVALTTPEDGATYLLGQSVPAEYTCADPESGIDACHGTVADGDPIPTSSVGTFTFTIDAENGAGGTASTTHGYAVAYDFRGFLPPVKNDGELNKAEAGRTIALKWQLLDANGEPVTDLAGVEVTVDDVSCERDDSHDWKKAGAAGWWRWTRWTNSWPPSWHNRHGGRHRDGLKHLGNGYYRYNWKTSRSYARSCKMLHLDLGEGLTRTATFSFK